ncbi:MAG: shikimate dehydrogenase [Leptolyngbyaceae cyanobacterium]
MTAEMMVTGTTQLLGIIGHPVEHSLSPVMQNAAIAHLNLDYLYLPFPVQPERLPQAMTGLEAIGVRGFNVTIPHKQAVIPLLTSVSDTARAIGAVNTVYRGESGWCGTNTDIIGFLAPLKAHSGWTEGTTVVLGNGGAARAVVAGCAQQGCQHIQVVSRNLDELEPFRASWQGSPIQPNLTVQGWDHLSNLPDDTTLIVNATPVGMYPLVDASPLTDEQWFQVSPQCIAYDLIYTPSPTLFLQQAQKRGAIAIDGRDMLVQQGAAALGIWLETQAPVAVMAAALNRALNRALD